MSSRSLTIFFGKDAQMPTAEAKKMYNQVPSSPRIDRLKKHVDHIRDRVSISDHAIKEHMKRMLREAEEALQQATQEAIMELQEKKRPL